MGAEIITKEDLELFKAELIAEISRLLEREEKAETEWVRSSEARKILSLSPNTLQSIRISGKLKYTKIGSIFYYRRADIRQMLEGENHGQ